MALWYKVCCTTLKKEMNRFSEVINGEQPVLVDFFAEWCGPCKTMAPILKQAKDAVGEKVKIIKVDIDKNPDAARQFDIQGVPTLILFLKGQVKWRQSGVVPANALIQVLNTGG
jgi:thioredoxin 1